MPSETEAWTQHLLRDVGLDFSQPDLLLAWKGFQQVAFLPVVCESDYLLFQVGNFKGESYFDFARSFKLRDSEEEDVIWYEQLHIEFLTKQPYMLEGATVESWSFDFGTYAEFFATVEKLPEFQAALSVPNWLLTVYHTGV